MKNYTLSGTLKTKTSLSLSCLIIEAWDKDVKNNDLLDRTVSKADGSFSMQFTSLDFEDHPIDHEPDLFFRVYKGKQLLLTTEDKPMKNLSQQRIEGIVLDLLWEESEEIKERPVYQLALFSGLSRKKAEQLEQKLKDRNLDNSYKGIEHIIKEGLVNEKEGRSMQLYTVFSKIAKEDDKVVYSLQHKKWQQLDGKKAQSLQEMVQLEWGDIHQAIVDDPKLNVETADAAVIAHELLRELETTFPTQRLEKQIVPPISSLHKILEGENFKKEVKPLMHIYKGFGLQEIIENESILQPDKAAAVWNAVTGVSTFFKQNTDLNLLHADLSKKGLAEYNFEGVEAASKDGLIKTLKGLQRILKMAPNTSVAASLLANGYNAAIDIAQSSLYELMDETQIPYEQAYAIHQTAQNQAIYVANVAHNIGEVYVPSIPLDIIQPNLPIDNDLLAELDDYADFFGNQSYCNCSDCASVLSPAAYFVDLMQYIQKNISSPNFRNRQDHLLKLEKRRPDLWSLALTCENTNKRIPYLEIINEVMEQYIRDRNEWSLSTIYNVLSTTVSSFKQPFHLPLETLRVYLSHFQLTLKDIANRLLGATDLSVFANLELSVIEATLIQQPNTNNSFLKQLYSIEDSLLDKIDVQDILPKTYLSRKDFGAIINTKFVKAATNNGKIPRIEASKRNDESVQNDVEYLINLSPEALDRIHRFTRLYWHLPWEIAELDEVIAQFGLALNTIAAVKQLQDKLGDIPIMELLGLIGTLPNDTFNEVFNSPYFEKTEGRLPSNDQRLLHPALKPEGDAIRNPMVHRLLASLQLDDDSLLLLIEHLSDELGLSPQDASFALSRENLGLLYQYARLAEAMKISIAELIAWKAVKRIVSFSENAIETIESLLATQDLIGKTALSVFDCQALCSFAIEEQAVKAWQSQFFHLIETNDFLLEKEEDALAAVDLFLPEVLGLPLEMIKVLLELLNIGVEPPIFLVVLQTKNENSALLELLTQLQPWIFLKEKLSLDIEDFQLIKNQAIVFELEFSAANKPIINWEFIYRLAQYHTLKKQIAEASDLLPVLFGALPNWESVMDELLQLTGVRADYLKLILQHINHPTHPIEDLSYILDALSTSQLLGINGESLSLLVSNEYEDLENASTAIIAAFRAKYSTTEVEKLTEPLENQLLEAKRDALTDYLINSIHPEFNSVHDLYYYFLLDTELESCATTSRIVAANASLQLYVQRVMMQLEKDRDEEIVVEMDESARMQWDWRKNYRVWEANRKVFLYPENYILPELKDNKTPLFANLENALAQQDVNDATVADVYRNYLTELSEIANLKQSGSYYYEGILYLIGRTTDSPTTHYYRTYTIDTQVWTAWTKIEVGISTNNVSPIVFQNTLYLFWLEITSKPIKKVVNGTTSLEKYMHKLVVNYTSILPNGKWQKIQKILLPNLYTRYSQATDGWTEEPLNNGVLFFSGQRSYNIADDYTLSGVAWERLYLQRRVLDGEEMLMFFMPHPTHEDGIVYQLLLRTNTVDRRDVNFNGYESLPASMAFLNQTGRKLRLKHLERANPSIFLTAYNYLYYGYQITSSNLYVQSTGPEFAEVFSRGEGSLIHPINNLPNHFIMEVGSLSYLFIPLGDRVAGIERPFKIVPMSTSYAAQLSDILYRFGLSKMMSLATQEKLEEFKGVKSLDGFAIPIISAGGDKFDLRKAYGVYFKELFYHIPNLIAAKLNANRKYEAAQKWYHYIFNPMAKDDRVDNKEKLYYPYDRVWQYHSFRALDAESLSDILTNTAAIEKYKEDPFNPHAIARLRTNAYQKTTVMNYIDNLLDWGDQLFGMDTMESINEASLIYVMAYDILGRRPAEIGDCEQPEASAMEYRDIVNNNSWGGEFLKEIETLVYRITGVNYSQTSYQSFQPNAMMQVTENKSIEMASRAVNPITQATHQPIAYAENYLSNNSYSIEGSANTPLVIATTGYQGTYEFATPTRDFTEVPQLVIEIIRETSQVFCVPNNHQLLDYWNRVEDRLYKIRHCMNLQGVERQIALFQPPIDPMMLVRAKAAGLSLQDILSQIANTGNILYQFRFLLEKAKGLTALAQSFGAAMMAALGQQDAEALALIRSEQQLNLQNMYTQLKEKRIEELQHIRENLENQRASIEYKLNHYQSLIEVGLLEEEQKQLNLKTAAQAITGTIAGLHLGVGLAYATDVTLLGIAGPEISVGERVAHIISSGISMLATTASVLESNAGTQAIHASNKRRKQGWLFQKDLINTELKNIEKQLIINDIQLETAERSLEIHGREIEYNEEVYDFLKNKFGNKQLYTWLTGELQGMYRQAYQMAYEMAKKAELAYAFERDDSTLFLQNGNWDSSKAGLMAGQRLIMQLTQLENAYLNSAERSMEVRQSFSLRMLNAAQLLQLQEMGTCDIEIPEVALDLTYPGHYKRRLRAMTVTIPCVTGPYVNVNATLTLLDSQIRKEPNIDASALQSVYAGKNNAIVLSSGESDSGILFMDFHNDKYLPFEGAGAISKWKLELPSNFRTFDYGTISDVIVTLAYTAKYDGVFKGEVEGQLISEIENMVVNIGALQYINLKQHFASEYRHLLLRAPHEVTLNIDAKVFPYYLKSKIDRIKVNGIQIYIEKRGDIVWADMPLTLTIDDVNAAVLDLKNPEETIGEDMGKFGYAPMNGQSPIKNWQLRLNSNNPEDTILEDWIQNIHIIIAYSLE